jgi:hypothetical protein
VIKTSHEKNILVGVASDLLALRYSSRQAPWGQTL